jgi:hypothetical protein
MARHQFIWHVISSYGTASVHMARHRFIWHDISSHGTVSVPMARHQFIRHDISSYGTASVHMAWHQFIWHNISSQPTRSTSSPLQHQTHNATDYYNLSPVHQYPLQLLCNTHLMTATHSAQRLLFCSSVCSSTHF